MEMLAVSASHQKAAGVEDEEAVANDEDMPESKKRELLQKAITMAASNGDAEKVKKILDGKARDFVDLNASDEDGTPPLIYASCFVSITMIISHISLPDVNKMAGPRGRSPSLDQRRSRYR